MDKQEIYLRQNHKFWHCQSVGSTDLMIRVGHLIENDDKFFEEALEQEVVKQFENEQECLNYMTESIVLKMEKGYEDFDKKKIKRLDANQNQKYKIQVQKPQDDLENKPIKQPKQTQLIPLNEFSLSISQLTDKAVSQKSLNSSQRSSVASQKYTDNDGDDNNLGKAGHGPISVLLAQNWDGEDPTGRFISEKLDGMRMIWTGTSMYSRNGNIINFPKFFVAGWPKVQLDGELWLDRDQFQKLVSITKRNIPNDEDWRRVKFMVFDAPGLNAPFKIRYERFKKAIETADSQYMVCVPHIVCASRDHLTEELEKVMGEMGEGLMLRDPEGRYEGRRSKVLQKVKKFDDDEATIIGHEQGTGRCAGMCGSLRVVNSWGCEFSIGSGLNDVLRKKPPQKGTVITYKYWGVSKNQTPRFPIYMRIREKE